MKKIYTWNEIARDYLKIAKDDKFIHYLDSPKFIDLLGDLSDKSVLDLGCGNGLLVNKLVKKGIKNYLGVDLSEILIEVAKANKGSKVDFKVSNLEPSFEFGKKKYDVVLAKMLLMYIKDVDLFLSNVSNVIKKDGVFAVSILHPSRPLINYSLGKNTEYSKTKYYFADTESTVSFAHKELRFYYRSLSTYIESFIDAGFSIVATQEIVPDKKFIEKYPDEKKKLGVPITMHFLLKKMK
jgi:2-polyprenyl-3-methyl-5-hydroxy-6-metoxy-1,4-benzoquinol methylase